MANYEDRNGDYIPSPLQTRSDKGYFTNRGTLMDRNWIRRSFLVDAEDLSEDHLKARTNTTAKFKFVTSGPGGNLVVNPLPQPCIYTDPPPPKTTLGQDMWTHDALGAYHSEIFDDNMHVIHMRFGLPAFNSLWRFLNGMYDFRAGKYARTGRGMGIIYNIVRTGTSIIGTLLFWPIQGLSLMDKVARFFLDKPSSRFYYMKPAMPMYWDTVQTIVNHLAANRGLIFYDSSFTKSSVNTHSDNYQVAPEERSLMHRLYPDLIDESGSIDVFALANRAQRQWRRKMDTLIHLGVSNPDSLGTRLRMSYNAFFGDDTFGKEGNVMRFYQYFQRWINNPAAQAGDPTNTLFGDLDQAGDNSFGPSGLGDFLEAEANAGGSWVSFRVNNAGTVSESFSNDFKTPEISEKFNSMSASMRDARFNFANGNLGDGILAELTEGVMGAMASAAKGLLDTIELDGLAILGGAAFADFPQYWDRSTANLPSMSYSVDLISPSNDPISQCLYIDIPLAMLLSAVLPRSSGKQSHVDPFLCELYDRGRAQTRLGMFKSMSISRGEGNIGWDHQGHALQVKVNFEVIDLGQIVTLPVSEAVDWTDTLTKVAGGAIAGTAIGGPAGTVAGGAIGAASALGRGLFDDDSYFNDYMAVLSGLGMTSQIHRFDKFRRRLTINVANAARLTSSARLSSYVMDTTIGSTLGAVLFHGNARMN